MPVLLLVLLGVGAFVGYLVHRARQWQATLQQIAQRHDLQFAKGSLLRAAEVTGAIGGVPIKIDTYSEGSGDSRSTYTRVVMQPHMPDGLVLRREGSFLGKLFKGADLEIGDPLFDGRVIVRGPTRAMRALLDGPTREAVMTAVSQRVTMGDGEIKWSKSGLADFTALSQAVDQLTELSNRLRRPADDVALAHVVRTDQLPVAIEASRILPAGEACRAIDAEVLSTRSDALVMIAAKRAGRSATEAAPAVRRVLEDASNPDSLRAEALTWLGRYADATAIARDHLTRPPIATVALDILKDAEPPVPLDTLARLAGQEGVAAAAVGAAVRHGVAAEALLIEAVGADDVVVARVAARGLGQVGTPNAVMALRERAKGLFADGQLKSAALAAIESIQGRVGVAGGGLSVVESSAAGRLSELQAQRTAASPVRSAQRDSEDT